MRTSKMPDVCRHFGIVVNDSDGEWGRGLIQDYGFRLYNPAASRFLSVDPLRMSFPWNSVYAFAENDVIRCIDLEGLEKISVNTVSFAPFETFGGGFGGDGADRKFGDDLSTNYGAENYRIRAKATIDLATNRLIEEVSAYGSMSEHESSGHSTFSEAEISEKSFTKKRLFFHLSGNNDAVPMNITPDIDVKVSFRYEYYNNFNSLFVAGSVHGDRFPSNETYLEDEFDNKVMLGVSGAKGNPFTSLPGDNYRQMSEFGFDIVFDEKGGFMAVTFGDKSYNLEAWNKRFKELNPQDGNIKTNASNGSFKTTE